MLSGFSHSGMAEVVIPTTAIFTPATVFTTYGANAGAPAAERVLAESQGKRAAFRAVSRLPRPKLNSWLPTTMAS